MGKNKSLDRAPLIYRLAKNNDRQAIKQLEENTSFTRTDLIAAMLGFASKKHMDAAYEYKNKALKFLIEEGEALRNVLDISETEEITEQVEYNIYTLYKHLIFTYSRTMLALPNELIEEAKNQCSSYSWDIALIKANILIKNEKGVAEILNENKNTEHYPTVLWYCLKEYEKYGNITNLVERLYENETDSELCSKMKSSLVSDYARNHFLKKATAIINSEKDLHERYSLKRKAIDAYIDSTKFDVEKLIDLIEIEETYKKSNELLLYAIDSCSKKGYLAETMHLLEQLDAGDSKKAITTIIVNYIKYVQVEPLNQFLATIANTYDVNDHLEDIKKEYDNHNRGDKIKYSIKKYFSEKEISYELKLIFLSHIDHPTLRNIIFDALCGPEKTEWKGVSKEAWKNKLEKLNTIIREKKLTYKQAQAWFLPLSILTWFLQGIQLVRQEKLQEELFIEIASLALGVSYKEAREALESTRAVIPEALYAMSVQSLSAKRFGSQFNLFPQAIKNQPKLTEEAYQAELKNAQERYNTRLSNNF